MAFGGGLDDDNEVMNEINMTPLVDVMLVLLIIFIITVPVLTHSVKVDLPRAAGLQGLERGQTLGHRVGGGDGACLERDDHRIGLGQIALGHVIGTEVLLRPFGGLLKQLRCHVGRG